MKPKQNTSVTKEAKVKDAKESKYALKLRKKQSEERKEKAEAMHSTKRVLLKTIGVKDQKPEKKVAIKETKVNKVSPRTRSQSADDGATEAPKRARNAAHARRVCPCQSPAFRPGTPGPKWSRP